MSGKTLSNERAQERASELKNYIVGFILALVLTLIPFGLVAFTDISRMQLYGVIGLCALIQIIVHFRFFLHITLARNKREDLQLILFSVLILAIMCGGTLWIIFNLYTRMIPSLAL
ncbi:cytochrome o ubiquinol oxidase subunit IV [Kushneria phosphatilytica]|uniref:Cytochrome bo(3) ubiquinol oxidase subunit 4 n=1 Tax=Kushneria phosphatilytica TaxID=657387 RepID=A0A1S1P3E8_9GAMM|nr:cytochrome o ubiquinol oxidase subunit IV [Kushneria phosphatilytica]OHV13929.1 cytochrome o ubiquinol oxidase subunit IV [Kushneria phosphatilytica]QEL10493.1 cytochrome o ubiquinol oxidase subunit IV [Kushneria phosphatilytica]